VNRRKKKLTGRGDFAEVVEETLQKGFEECATISSSFLAIGGQKDEFLDYEGGMGKARDN